MSKVRAWLDTRTPSPPRGLDMELCVGLGDESPLAELLQGSCARLDRARARPGRVRESAFELLVADALITYACEAALESEDPTTALGSLFEIGEDR